MPHAAPAETLEVFEQRALAALKLGFAHPLDRAHQVAERAHERQRSRMQGLDFGEQSLKQRSQAGPVGLIAFELVGQVGESVADRGQTGVSSRPISSPSASSCANSSSVSLPAGVTSYV